MDISSFDGVIVFEPYAFGAHHFLTEVNFLFGSSSVSIAYPAALKLASVIMTDCLFDRGCFEAI